VVTGGGKTEKKMMTASSFIVEAKRLEGNT
jgi:hypothetical protein